MACGASALSASRPPTAASGASAAVAARTRGDGDPHLWLEEIEGEEALQWCREQNSRTIGVVGDPLRSDAYAQILAIADSKDKIPYVGRIGRTTGGDSVRNLYNFWQVTIARHQIAIR